MSENIFIRSTQKAGSYRAGMFFSYGGAVLSSDALGEDQLAAIEADPRLVVTDNVTPMAPDVTDTPEAENGASSNTDVGAGIQDNVTKLVTHFHATIKTGDRKPGVKDMEGKLGIDTNADEINAAWAIFREES